MAHATHFWVLRGQRWLKKGSTAVVAHGRGKGAQRRHYGHALVKLPGARARGGRGGLDDGDGEAWGWYETA